MKLKLKIQQVINLQKIVPKIWLKFPLHHPFKKKKPLPFESVENSFVCVFSELQSNKFES